MKDHSYSFEFFPPKTEVGVEKLSQVSKELSHYNPAFYSVTYGAGGTTQDATKGTVLSIQKETGIATAPHLSCIGSEKEQIRQMLNDYKDNGINRIVALRGDLPSGMFEIGDFHYANELVEFIRAETGDHFQIEIAAYPEKHPQAKNFDADIENFGRKAKAGADRAITQYFFNADAYFHFMDSLEKAQIDIPVMPGIMPITNFSQMARFSDAIGAEIPRWLRMRFESYGDDVESIQKLGNEFVTGMCERLLEQGVPGLHFYSMNRVEPSLAIWNNLGLSEA
ncbi:methylenetetrahydrofolate reductase [NAD(P)H] [Cocleimonas flava]|uniref:Methylenetetrahydrofolate reductase n=1 Tax=Cocleimonas flava TaxID=634765 RepID=A0A4R1F570_9GAMM|nr:MULTISPECIES: methylenetetrahydrofolate reductase [NAD(P)H] [Cocleimonas]MEB8431331.1 methylenetetrahydrofolate reductase [NAD(P)H] [Cocleimonas sp. KMM 6892]MEC4713897.1 methylenetetrahydrofolate reductase [NAD(P)H] [Cocleimonas sp. KMM 6895]MEC4743228.1 methylenetetrahydrofolate reductase [NAD(P)H] [Cocleimonas sp. KMM 6896]TCJ89013.1 5,10-methylenetetrahydrofolate reductase (NAD(P)) [Cocleimonas flava]